MQQTQRKREINQNAQLMEFAYNHGHGIMDITGDDLPGDCIEFVLGQYQRFGVPTPQEVIPVVIECMDRVVNFINVIEPYMLFWDVSDVVVTTESLDYAYELKSDGAVYQEADPEWLETYRLVPGQDTSFFDTHIRMPGLDALPIGIGDSLRWTLTGDDGYYNDYDVLSSVPAAVSSALRGLFSDDTVKIGAFVELGAWATFLWIAGPMARRLRSQAHPIYEVCYKYGEAIMVDGWIYGPDDYRKLSRKPYSCHRCGLDAWCVELTADHHATRHICEACLSEGMPKVSDCGTKRCINTLCKHHPRHSLGMDGFYRNLSSRGQLKAFANNPDPRRVGLGDRSALDPKLLV